MGKLQNPQQTIYDYMVKFQQQYGYPPSVREICQGVGLNSTSTVHSHLTRLERKGLLRRDPTKPRAIQIPALQKKTQKQMALPIVREPGLPLENAESFASVPAGRISDPDAYILIVTQKAEISLSAGDKIHSGDHIIVSPAAQTQNGDLILYATPLNHGVESSYSYKIDCLSEKSNNLPMATKYEQKADDFNSCTLFGKIIGVFRKF